jgi:hypothetical protein
LLPSGYQAIDPFPISRTTTSGEDVKALAVLQALRPHAFSPFIAEIDGLRDAAGAGDICE